MRNLLLLPLLAALVLPLASRAAEPEIINLARTSLAAVSASSVNGSRPLDNHFYGVLNIFDAGGKPDPNGITYNYFLADPLDENPTIDIRFDLPVALQSIEVDADSDATFTATLTTSAGKSETFAKNDKPLKFDLLQKNITAVKIHLVHADSRPGRLARIDEIRLLGLPPESAKFTVGLPRIFFDARTAALSAKEAFDTWKNSLSSGLTSQTQETKDAFITTYTKDNIPVLRVTTTKSDGKTTAESLVTLTPKAETTPPPAF